MRSRLALLALALAALPACRTTVELTLTNVAKTPLVAQVEVRDAGGLVEGPPIVVGTVRPDARIDKRFDIEPGGQFVVRASLPDSAQVLEETRTVTADDPSPLEVAMDLAIHGSYVPEDPEQLLKIARGALERVVPEVGFRPVSVPNALHTELGKLVIVDEKDEEKKVLLELPPGLLSPRADLGTFPWPSDTVAREVILNRTAALALAFAVPLYGDLGFDFQESSLFKLSTEAQGVNWVVKPEPPGWDPITAFAALSPQVKSAIARVLQRHPTARLYYVNKLYVLKHLRVEKHTAVALQAGAKLSAGSILTTSGAYTFDRSSSEHRSASEKVLDVDGVPLDIGLLQASGEPLAHFPTAESESMESVRTLALEDDAFEKRMFDLVARKSSEEAPDPGAARSRNLPRKVRERLLQGDR